MDGEATAVATAQAQVEKDLPNTVKSSNYVITDADERAIEGGTPLEKFRQNVRAVRIVRKLAEEGREATAGEKVELARYVGWGGLKDAFNGQYGKAYGEERSTGKVTPQRMALVRKTPLGEDGYGLYREMRELLTDEELKFADASTSSAFYTPIRLCRSIHGALAKAGLRGGRLLETSAGVGNLIGTGGYSSPRWTAVEYDKVSGLILKALYPMANVRIQGFEEVTMPDNFYDAAISNVPFGDSHPFDPNYKKHGFVIHDFFFAKGVDKVHPGGVVAFVTSTGTLDKADKKLIRYLSEHGGKIVGAVRMPNGTFAKNAGTDVATDVIFIQKVEGSADNSEFLKTGTEKGCPISQYFIGHPDMCLGEKVAGSDQWGNPKLKYRGDGVSMGDIDAAIQKAASALEFKSANDSRKPSQIADVVDANGLANGNVGVVGGVVVRKIGGELVEVPKGEIPGLTAPLLKKGVTPQQVVRDLGALRDAQRKVIDAQLVNCSDEELKGLQRLLDAEYDRFVKRYGNLRQTLPKKFIDLDYAASPIILGLETETKFQDGVDGHGRPKVRHVYSKSDIFTKRTIFASPKATTAANALDGLRISLNETGAVDTARIAELTGKPEGDVRKELIGSGRVFVNPETSGIETRDEYLSGSVRRKLKAARAAAEIDETFKKNVEELLKVQPDDIAATDISYQLGQNWIPKDVYEQFIREAVYQGTSPRAKVTFDPVEHLWHVGDAHGRTEWDDESGLAVDDLLERMMNGRSVVVRRKSDEGAYEVDPEATTATKIVQEKIARAFQSWLTDDIERANRLERIYNAVMNDNVERKFDTDILEFHGLSEDWAGRVNARGREYQKKCIARGAFAGNLLIAHCVGAGKTFEMASICMQLRRLGIARKPMFAVPNHMLAQWDKEFHEAYPGAKVLVAGREDLSKARRRAFLAKVVNGNWDCVIIAHSSFSRISMSPEHQAEYIESEIADHEDVLANAESKKDRERIKKQIQSLRDRLKALLDPSRKDDSIKFEELGCDYLFVDEAHNFKGLQISTHMSNVRGVTGSVSQRAQDLEMKCRYIAKMHGGDKGVVFATGTPISNSISEMYVMMRYLAPTKMDDMGVRGFDDWAKQFGQVVNEWSPNPSGVGFREKARFSQFQNVPEMKRFFRSFADIVLDGDLDIKRPKPKEVKHVLKPSDAQRAYVASLNRRMERMQNTKVDPSVDNMLKVTTEGRLLAIDPALIGVKDESHARANACADEVKRIYDQSTGKVVKDRDGHDVVINGTQLIFCDSGVPKKRQFRGLVRDGKGNYLLASGSWTFTVTAPDAYGARQASGVRIDGKTVAVPAVPDHSVGGMEDLASVYAALDGLAARAGQVNAEFGPPKKGTKKARKPDGTAVDINDWLDRNADRIGHDPRFSSPYAADRRLESEPADMGADGRDAADDRDTSEEANGDVEVDNMLRGKFNMYAELRRQLIRRGIPAEEIAFIHDAETMTQKQALFDRVKKGEIRVLIGNTAKMGEGTNVQDMLVAIHHLDIPWKPAWITQRDGRGIRSGNMNDEVEIHKYITEGTFDVYSWDTVGRKAKFIENAMNARMDQRVIEDADSTVMSLEEGKAAAAGDPRILERVKLIKAIEKMQMEFDTQTKALDRAKMRYRVAEKELADAEKRAAEYTGAIKRFNEAKGKRPFTLTTIGDSPRELTDNAEVAREIQDRLEFFARKGSDVGLVGRVFGFDLRYERDGNDARIMIKELYVDVPVTILPGMGASFPPADLSMLKAKITSHTGERELQWQEYCLDDRRRRLNVAKKGVENAKGFDRDAAEDEIGKSRLALARLNKALGIKDNGVRSLARAYADSRGLAPDTPEVDFDTPELGEDADARREYEAVVARYTNPDGTRKPGWMKAPNGRPTNLTERQWVQVRTPSFKRWFGDWERGAVADAILGDADIVVENGILDLSPKEQRAAAKAIYDELKAGGPVVTMDGRSVKFTGVGFKEIKQHSADPHTLAIVPILRNVIATAHYIGEGDTVVENGNKLKYHLYARRVNVGDGSMIARIVLREDVNGNIFYDEELSSVENIREIADSATRKPNAGQKPQSPYAPHSIAEFFAGINPASVSKVVDENGEPKVVYHGARGGKYFTEFDYRHNFPPGGGNFFFSDIEGAAYFGNGHENVYSVFLKIVNPYETDNNGRWHYETKYKGGKNQWVDGVAVDAKEDGQDGVIVKNVKEGNGYLGDDYVVFSPTQIKSATDNTGAFDERNPDINFDSPELSGEGEREAVGFTNEDIEFERKIAGLKPIEHKVKPAELMFQQANGLLTNRAYMEKLANAVAKAGRATSPHENIALGLFHEIVSREEYDARKKVESLQSALGEMDAIPKDERDADYREARNKAAKDVRDAKKEHAAVAHLLDIAGQSKKGGVGDAARTVLSQRFLADKVDFTYSGIRNAVRKELKTENGLTPEMERRIFGLSKEFEALDESQKDVFVSLVKTYAEKELAKIKKGEKIKRAVQSRPSNEAKRVVERYNDALTQLEVAARETGGIFVGLADEKQPGWGKFLRAIAEYHCFENPDIKVDEVVQKMIETLRDCGFDAVDGVSVWDEWTGYGHSYRQSRYESQRRANWLKSQALHKRQILHMDDTNTLPLSTGMERDVDPTPEGRALAKDVYARKMEVPDAGRDARRLKGVLESAKTRLRNDIADLERAIETGERIPGRERTVAEDIELRELKKRKEELRKTYDELFKTERGMTDEQRVRLAEKAVAKQLEYALADLERARSGDFSKRARRSKAESPTLDALHERLDEARKERLALKRAAFDFGMTPEELEAFNARRLKRREDSLVKYAERIASGDIRTNVKPQPPMPLELQKRYDELGEEQKRARRKMRQLREDARRATWWRPARAVDDYWRFITGNIVAHKASVDRSAVLRQALMLTAAHPVLAAKNMVVAEHAAWSKRAFDEVNAEILADPIVKDALKFGLKLRSSDISNTHDVEMFSSVDRPPPEMIRRLNELLDGIPLLGRVYGGARKLDRAVLENSERHYVTFLNLMSAQTYKMILDAVPDATDFQKRRIANLVNILSGHGMMSNKTRSNINAINDALGHLIWSPSLAASQIQQALFIDVLGTVGISRDGGRDGGFATMAEVKPVMKEAVKMRVRAELALLAIGALLALLWGDDDWKDELKNRWASVKTTNGWMKKSLAFVRAVEATKHPVLGKTHIDLEMGKRTVNRVIGLAATGEYENSRGRAVRTTDFKSRDLADMLGRMFYGKMSPHYGALFDAANRKTFTGEPINFGLMLVSLLPIPLSVVDVVQSAMEDEWHNGQAPMAIALTLLGAGGNVYDEPYYERAVNRFLDAKKEYDAIEKDELLDEQNRRLLLDSIVAENPLMREGVREDIAADIARIRRDEARAKRDGKKGLEADASRLAGIERGKAKLIEKIRAERGR